MQKTVRERITEARKNYKPGQGKKDFPGSKKHIEKIAGAISDRNHKKIKSRQPIGFD